MLQSFAEDRTGFTSAFVKSAATAPLVSIGMPVFNEAGNMRNALDSVLGQSYPNIELIISDNASTDGTADICREYARRDPRVRLYRNSENLGSAKNQNRTFALARGKYFCWVSPHDERGLEFVARCVEVLEGDPAVVLCHTGAAVPTGHAHDTIDTRPLADDPVSRFNAALWGIRDGWPVYGVYRSAALARTRVMAPSVACDIALLVELSLHGTFAYLPEMMLKAGGDSELGDWHAYLRRMKPPPRGAAGHYLAFGRALIGAVFRSDLPANRKAACFASVGLALAYKYRWLYGALLRARI